MKDMINTAEKTRIKRALISAALTTLEKEGWKVERQKFGKKGRVRKITKNGLTQLAAIRTSQDGMIAFTRNREDTKWVTLSDVDLVVAASVDNEENPKFAQVHLFEAKELRDRFDRAYAARRKAGHSIPLVRGIWVALYREESNDPVSRVGAGIGLAHPSVAQIPLNELAASNGSQPPVTPPTSAAGARDDDFESLTIAQAKDRLARTLGVDPRNIKITVEA